VGKKVDEEGSEEVGAWYGAAAKQKELQPLS
jgi:hypothetical protein